MAKATVRETATKPLYAYLGAGDKAVELVRKYADELQDQVEDFRKTGVQESVTDRADALAKQAKNRQLQIESYLKDLQGDVRALPKRAEERLAELQAELRELTGKLESWINEFRDDLTDQVTKVATYEELVARGEKVVARVRGEVAEAQTKAGYKTDSVASKTASKVDKAADKASSTTSKAADKASTSSNKAAAKTKSTSRTAANKTKSSAEKSASKSSAQATRSKAQATRAKSTATKKDPVKKTASTKSSS